MIKGIDISKYQAVTPALDELGFVFVRASYATTLDPKYVMHTTAVRKAGLVVGAYHFGVGFKTPAEQVKVFLAATEQADLLALDLERDTAKTMTQDEAREFIDLVHRAGRKIGLYHSRSGFPALGQDWNWIAQWRQEPPTGMPWTFWQYRGSPLDLDYFNGTQDDLLKLAGKVPAPPSTGTETHLILKANAASPAQSLIDVKKGGQVFRLDGTPLVKWSKAYTITSLGQSDAYDLVVVTTGGVRQYALVLTKETSNRRQLGTPSTTPPPPAPAGPTPQPSPPPTSTTVPINLVPNRSPSTQPPGDGSFSRYGWAGQWEDGWSPYGAWVTRPTVMPNKPAPPIRPPVFILVHGGPLPLSTLAGMDGLASWIAARGGIGVAIKYPMLREDGTWQEGVAAIRQAIAKGKATGAPVTLVGHSAGGLFVSLATFNEPAVLPDRLVFVAADDQVGTWPQPTQPPNPRGMYSTNRLPATVVTGSADLVTTVEEAQSMVTALNATGHPGKWLVVDWAGHSDILSDVGFINTLI